jgi:hypothetical protein
MALVDIGNGLKQFVPDDPVGVVQKQMDLMDLVQRRQNNQLEGAIKEATLQLKSAEVEDLALSRAKVATDLLNSRAQLAKSQIELNAGTIKSGFDALQAGQPEVAKAYFNAIGAQLMDNKADGGYRFIGQSGMTLDYNPASVRGEKERREESKKLRNEYQKVADQYATVDSNYKIALKNAAMKNGSADLGLLIAIAKIYDPTSVVREGEVVMQQQFSSIADNLNRMYKRVAEGSSEGIGDQKREELIQMARVAHSSWKDVTQSSARSFYDISGRMGLNPADVVIPAGAGDTEISYKLFEPKTPPKQPGTAPGTPAPSAAAPSAQPAAPAATSVDPATDIRKEIESDPKGAFRKALRLGF